jgi:DNA adenine methylase
MKTPLKWVGGKTQILAQVLAEFPRTIQNYYEPFLGGGSVLFGLLESGIDVKGTLYASDVNPVLINFFTMLKEKPHHLIACFNVLVSEYTGSDNQEDFYYRIRAMFNGMPKDGPEAAATFLFLNRTCFRGVYREGPNGFNVPFGHYKSAPTVDESTILALSSAIQRVTFRCEEFESALNRVAPGDFVYLDPPYVPETSTSFVGYVAGGFSSDMHSRLFECLRALPTQFVMSNADVPLLETEFPPPFQTKKIGVRRAIHSRDPSSTATEVLITNGSTHPVS